MTQIPLSADVRASRHRPPAFDTRAWRGLTPDDIAAAFRLEPGFVVYDEVIRFEDSLAGSPLEQYRQHFPQVGSQGQVLMISTAA